MNISAKIKGIQYRCLLCKELREYKLSDLKTALEKESSFILKVDDKMELGMSRWVSPKRTRSYPYERVYNTLGLGIKKVTIIPIIKDEGKDGDRDFLQWDTISLMSLLGVYVIIAYYTDAKKSMKKYANKITRQRFDLKYIKDKITNLISYQSDALHWNLKQTDEVGMIGDMAINSYVNISKKLEVQMHSIEKAQQRINKLKQGRESFINLSRNLAEKAQKRESLSLQASENLEGEKGEILINNFLGGIYYFVPDEVEIIDDNILITEAKHTKRGNLPSMSDIKDGLLRMVIFTNLENVEINDKQFKPIPRLKLTSKEGFDETKLSKRQKKSIEKLRNEASENKFELVLK
ncbi:MAG: hypothetical protein K8T10_01645 [Candidatus Eremiobacteraeota bacterium]|nr:hypothetical protein [Candidatus Eremiobacteraeota bacterium]